MKRIFSIVLFVFVLFTFSCNNINSTKEKTPKGDVWKFNKKGDSVLMKYNDKGRLLSYSTYKNGIKHGLAKKFFSNGKPEFVIRYKDGNKHGKVLWYYENEKLYRETFYEKGKRTGIQKKYYETGKLMAEVPWHNGKVQPGLKEYMKSGKLKKIYPKLIIEPIDKLAFENKYILRCYLSDKSTKAKFSQYVISPNGEIDYLRPFENNNGYADLEFFITKGGYKMSKELIHVEYKTSLKNIYVIEREYNLAVDN